MPPSEFDSSAHMRIWVINHYADSPDRQATRTFDLCRELVRHGHTATIFSSSFSHYRHREERLRPGQLWVREDIEGVRFIWIRTSPYQQNNWRRVFNMITFMIGTVAAAGVREHPDVIVGVTVHPLAPLAAYALARLRRCRFLLEVTDLWPETLIQFGDLSAHSPIAWSMRRLETFLFRRAERILMLWPRGERYVATTGVSPSKVVWLPHGVPLDRYAHLLPYNGEGKDVFTIMYAGGLVRANALEVILAAARILQQEENGSIRFVFVGDGADRDHLRAQAADLRNVEFRDAVPKRELWVTLAEADAFVLSLADLPLYRYGISLNKLCDYMACGRPILFAGRPAYDPVNEAQAGITVPPADPAALAAAAKRLAGLPPVERERMGANARLYVEKNHNIVKLADRLERVLLGQE